jgi:hypothetical protein
MHRMCDEASSTQFRAKTEDASEIAVAEGTPHHLAVTLARFESVASLDLSSFFSCVYFDSTLNIFIILCVLVRLDPHVRSRAGC